MNRPSLSVLGSALALCLAGCKPEPTAFPSSWHRTVQHGDAVSGAFENGQGEVFMVPDEEIKDIPRCEGTVVEKVPCAAVIKTADGQFLHIGSPGATADVAGFVTSLEEGQTCALPGAFLEYQKRRGASARKDSGGAP